MQVVRLPTVSTPPPIVGPPMLSALESDGQGVALAEVDRPARTLADVGDITGRDDAPESSIGGETTCVVCMFNPKSHLAVPCGHQCACSTCAAQMKQCPYCRAPVLCWVEQRMV